MTYFNINDDKLEQIKKLIPNLDSETINDFILADWPEGKEHQSWLDSATPEQIADWVIAGN
jgi:hypothetical protein